MGNCVWNWKLCHVRLKAQGLKNEEIIGFEEACPARLHHWYFSWKSLAKDLISLPNVSAADCCLS